MYLRTLEKRLRGYSMKTKLVVWAVIIFVVAALLLFIFTKEDKDMAVIYATLIIKGKKTFDQVPAKLQPEVRQILIDCDCEYLIEG